MILEIILSFELPQKRIVSRLLLRPGRKSDESSNGQLGLVIDVVEHFCKKGNILMLFF